MSHQFLLWGSSISSFKRLCGRINLGRENVNLFLWVYRVQFTIAKSCNFCVQVWSVGNESEKGKRMPQNNSPHRKREGFSSSRHASNDRNLTLCTTNYFFYHLPVLLAGTSDFNTWASRGTFWWETENGPHV